ncbi:MAG: hypothetical protein P4L83_25365 [Nevskia sp.]|nr:hypothetical protein [Nevskia sp.]
MNEFEERRDGGEEAPLPALAVLKQDCVPPRDLWPGIAARVQARRVRRRRAPWLAAVGLAASALLVLGVSVGIQGLRGRTAEPASGSGTIVGAVDQGALLPAANHLHPETRALVKTNLKVVDDAENQLRRAMAADPDDAYLKSLLASTRQQKQQLHIVLADAR